MEHITGHTSATARWGPPRLIGSLAGKAQSRASEWKQNRTNQKGEKRNLLNYQIGIQTHIHTHTHTQILRHWHSFRILVFFAYYYCSLTPNRMAASTSSLLLPTKKIATGGKSNHFHWGGILIQKVLPSGGEEEREENGWGAVGVTGRIEMSTQVKCVCVWCTTIQCIPSVPVRNLSQGAAAVFCLFSPISFFFFPDWLTVCATLCTCHVILFRW